VLHDAVTPRGKAVEHTTTLDGVLVDLLLAGGIDYLGHVVLFGTITVDAAQCHDCRQEQRHGDGSGTHQASQL
jgi:hypothetical protein